MAGKRLARLNEQLKREISEIIRRDVRDPRVGLVTITAVDTAADLGSARVYVRAIGTPGDLDETLAGLDAAAPFMRRELGQVLRVRKVPELRFRRDHSFEHARRIEEILSDVIVPEEEGEAEVEQGDVGSTSGDEGVRTVDVDQDGGEG